VIPHKDNIAIIAAPAILGLRPSGVERLAETLLNAGLQQKLGVTNPVHYVETGNEKYSSLRDPETHCLNPQALRDFSIRLGAVVAQTTKKHFPIILGGDCSILVGIMSGLAKAGTHGIISLDAHADFYQAEKSTTGEAADMDMALITGRGPDILTDIHHLKPYVRNEHAIHLGQRDWEETQRYGSMDIRQTAITCFNLAEINNFGTSKIVSDLLQRIDTTSVDSFWLHYDTDVLSDDINPAVDYRLPGGLTFEQVELLVKPLLATGRIAGLSLTILNPVLDLKKQVVPGVAENLVRIFS
jgi:arginase